MHPAAFLPQILQEAKYCHHTPISKPIMAKIVLARSHLLSKLTRERPIPDEIRTVSTESSFSQVSLNSQRRGRPPLRGWLRKRRNGTVSTGPQEHDESKPGGSRATTTSSKITRMKKMKNARRIDLRSTTMVKTTYCKLWSSTTAFQLYLIIAIALYSEDFKWFNGVSLILILKMFKILSKWATYARKGSVYVQLFHS
jgi:hypothetical protein